MQKYDEHKDVILNVNFIYVIKSYGNFNLDEKMLYTKKIIEKK